ncbi:protein KAKU4 isoform X2 [Humulus lupulus]|uniref:protein KAKU4 isoform X2 n=1 Tax=Humulus lupulus TaxID=3486 RepID=UPI002B416956|nr:protein KAKU4 isoform X2 [Humulus lupulus]
MVTNSRSQQNLEARSGGKIVRTRRIAGARATPYERPRVTNPEPKNPNWLSKIIFSPTRMIASGAGKLISSVFYLDDSSTSSSSSSSSSSLGSDSNSEGNCDNNYVDDISSQGTDILNERKGTSEVINYFRKDPEPTLRKRDTKHAIEELLMQETFTREECNKLIKIIKSRVVDGFNTKDAEKGSLTLMPNEASGDMHDLRCRAVMEARKWTSAKKLKSASKSDLHNAIEAEVGSPVDMAKVYMRTRPQWSSPTFSHGEIKSSSPISAHLFNAETPYSIGGNSLSSSKPKWDTPNTGSWNIQEEIQKVRAKATEEMLRNSPSEKIDWSASGFENRAIPSSQGLDMILDGSQNEASSLNQVNIIAEQNQDLEMTHALDGEGPKDGLADMACKEHKLHSSKDIKNASPSNAGIGDVPNYNDTNTSTTLKQLSAIEAGSLRVTDPRFLENNCTISERVSENENGLPGLSTGAGSDHDHHEGVPDGEEHNTATGKLDGETCELLSETYIEIPNVSDSMNENDKITNGSPNGPSMNNVSPRVTTRQNLKRGPAAAANVNATVDAEKRQGKRLSRYSKRKL